MSRTLPNNLHCVKANDGYWYVEAKSNTGMEVHCSGVTKEEAMAAYFYSIRNENEPVPLIAPGIFGEIVSAIVANAARDRRQAKG